MRSSAISGSRQNRQAQIFLLNHSDNQNPKITFFLSLFTDPQPSQHTLQRGTFFTCSKSDYCVILRDTRFWHETKKNKKKHQCNANSTVKSNDMTWLVACCDRIYVCVHMHTMWECVCVCGLHLTVHACWSGPCGASDLSSPAGTAGCLPGDSALGLTAVSIQHHYLTCAYCQLTCGGNTHTYISESMALKIRISIVKSCYINFNMKV